MNHVFLDFKGIAQLQKAPRNRNLQNCVVIKITLFVRFTNLSLDAPPLPCVAIFSVMSSKWTFDKLYGLYILGIISEGVILYHIKR